MVEFRRRTLLPLDDVLGCLRGAIPGSPAAPCTAAWNGTASPPARDEELPSKRKRFAETRIGYVHIDGCELRFAPKASCPCSWRSIGVSSSPTSSSATRQLTMANGAAFMREVVGRLPLPHPHRADRQRHGLRRSAQELRLPPESRPASAATSSTGVCDRARHRAQARPKPYHPWTNGQAERMNRTVKDGHRQDVPLRDLESLKAHAASLRWQPTTSPSTSRRCDGGHLPGHRPTGQVQSQ